MEFKEAIEVVIKKYGLTIVNNNFLFYSLISDLIGTSLYSRRLTIIFYEVNERINLLSLFKNNSLENGRRIISNDFKIHDYKCSKKEYVDAINPISAILRPKEYEEYELRKRNIYQKNTKLQCQVSNKNLNNNIQNLINYRYQTILNKKEFNQIKISGICKTIYIFTNRNFNYDVYKENEISGELIKKEYLIVNDSLNVKIDDKDGIYYVSVPEKNYELTSVNLEDGNVIIYGNNSADNFYSKNVNICAHNGKTCLRLYSKVCNLTGINGDITLNGAYWSLNIDKINSNINGNICFKSEAKEQFFTCKLANGSIDIKIDELPMKVEKCHLWKKKEYFKSLYMSDKVLKCDIKTLNGKIKMYPAS